MATIRSTVEATEAATQTHVLNVWTEFDAVAQPIVLAVATIALAYMGYQMWTGRLRMRTDVLLPRLLRWAVILALLLNGPELYAVVYPMVTEVPEEIAKFLLAQAGGGMDEDAVLGLVETVMEAGMNSASAVWQDSGYLDLSSHFVSLLLMVTTLALAVVAMTLLMLSKLAVGILLAAGPFFLALRLLDIGKGLFEGWLRQLLTFALIPVFVYSLIGLNFVILTTAHTQLTDATLTDQLTLTQIVPFILVAFANLLLLTQVMSWSGGVGGGVTLAVSAGAVMQNASQLYRYTQPLGQRAAGMATNTADMLRRRLGRPGNTGGQGGQP